MSSKPNKITEHPAPETLELTSLNHLDTYINSNITSTDTPDGVISDSFTSIRKYIKHILYFFVALLIVIYLLLTAVIKLNISENDKLEEVLKVTQHLLNIAGAAALQPIQQPPA